MQDHNEISQKGPYSYMRLPHGKTQLVAIGSVEGRRFRREGRKNRYACLEVTSNDYDDIFQKELMESRKMINGSATFDKGSQLCTYACRSLHWSMEPSNDVCNGEADIL